MRLRVDLDREVSARLAEAAAAERRPIPWQAEVMLRRALGLPFRECGVLVPTVEQALPPPSESDQATEDDHDSR